MKIEKLREMETLLALKFERKKRLFAQIVAQETQLRSKLKKIHDQAKEAEQSEVHQIKAIGADVIWKAWVNRTQTSLNMELAQVLAQKERMLVSVRKEYGKLLVSRELVQNEIQTTARAAQKSMLEKNINARPVDPVRFF